jgi:hypothetical protein
MPPRRNSTVRATISKPNYPLTEWYRMLGFDFRAYYSNWAFLDREMKSSASKWRWTRIPQAVLGWRQPSYAAM